MKFALAIAVVLLVSMINAKLGDPAITSGPDLETKMEGEMQGTWILFFFKKSSPSSRVSSLRTEVKSKILDVHPDFHYYECDVDSGSFNDVVDKFKIDDTELKHSPTVMVASEGTAYWVHGDGCVDDIVSHLTQYSGELRRAANQ